VIALIPTVIGAIPTAPGARRTWNLPALTRPGRVYVLEGMVLIAQPDGTMQPWPPFGHRSIASDPDARRD
jgi:hypothetical protein